MSKLPLYIKIIIGLVLGLVVGVLASQFGFYGFVIDWVKPFGTIFIRLLTLVAVPLVLFSIISGVSSLSNTAMIGKMALKTILFYLTTTVLAISIGLILVNTIKPGTYSSKEARTERRFAYESWAKQNDVNIKDELSFSTKYPKQYEKYVALHPQTTKSADEIAIEKKAKEAREQAKKEGPLKPLVDLFPKNAFESLSNNKMMLQVIVFAVFFGISLSLVKQEKVQAIKNVVDGLNEVFLKMIDLIMQASPFFVFALMAGSIAGTGKGNLMSLFYTLGMYFITVLVGLLIIGFVVYPLLVVLFTKKKVSIGSFLAGVKRAQLMAFSTSSSAATLPTTIDCVENKLGVSKNVSSFVLPIGATVNMDGTSLYQAVAVVFLAQMHFIDLTLQQQLTIVATTTLASIGSAAVPSAGLVMMIIVLESVGLNPVWITIIIPIDRLLDMCRTVINVTGDAAVTTIIAYSENEIENPEQS